MRLVLGIVLASAMLAQTPVPSPFPTGGSGGGGSGTVTSVGLAGTANQITVTGTSPITSSGSWTLSFPTNMTLPGTTTGTFSGNVTGNLTGTASTATNALSLGGNLANTYAPLASPTFTGTVTIGTTLLTNPTALSTPSAPTVTNQGTPGSDAYGYAIYARNAIGSTVASATGSTATGNGTLDGTNFNRVTWAAVTGATCYDVFQNNSPTFANYGIVAQCVVGTTFDDKGPNINPAVDYQQGQTTNTTQGVWMQNAAFGALRATNLSYDPTGYAGSPQFTLGGTATPYALFLAQGDAPSTDPSFGLEEPGFMARTRNNNRVFLAALGPLYTNSDPINTADTNILDAYGANGLYVVGENGPIHIIGGPNGFTYNEEVIRAMATVIGIGPNMPSRTTLDLGISRNAAGVLEINSGTPGTLRDLKARTADVTGMTFNGHTCSLVANVVTCP